MITDARIVNDISRTPEETFLFTAVFRQIFFVSGGKAKVTGNPGIAACTARRVTAGGTQSCEQ